MVETMGFVPSPLQGPKPRASDHVPFRDLEFRGRRPGVERGAGVKGWRELGRVRYALRWIDGGAARKGLSEDDREGGAGVFAKLPQRPRVPLVEAKALRRALPREGEAEE